MCYSISVKRPVTDLALKLEQVIMTHTTGEGRDKRSIYLKGRGFIWLHTKQTRTHKRVTDAAGFTGRSWSHRQGIDSRAGVWEEGEREESWRSKKKPGNEEVPERERQVNKTCSDTSCVSSFSFSISIAIKRNEPRDTGRRECVRRDVQGSKPLLQQLRPGTAVRLFIQQFSVLYTY